MFPAEWLATMSGEELEAARERIRQYEEARAALSEEARGALSEEARATRRQAA